MSSLPVLLTPLPDFLVVLEASILFVIAAAYPIGRDRPFIKPSKTRGDRDCVRAVCYYRSPCDG